MTLTDAALVRDLAERTDRAVPPMALEPANVLEAGRRYRRRRTVSGGSVGVLAVAAVAVAVVQVGAGPGLVTAPAAQSFVLVDGLTATVPTSPTAIQTALGPGVDLGLPADDVHSYVVVVSGHDLVIRRIAADGAIGGEPWDLGNSISYPQFVVNASASMATIYGQGGPDIEVTLVSAPADGTAPLTIPVPTAHVEGFFGALYMLRIDGTPADGVWPELSVEVRSPDGTATIQRIELPFEPPPGAETPEVRVASDVRPVDTDDGPAFDLGVHVGDGSNGVDQAATYVLSVTTVGEMAPPAANLTPEERARPAVLLSMLASDGSTVGSGAGGSVAEALVPDNRNPIWQTSLSDHEISLVGIRPPALGGASFEVVVTVDGVDERKPIPTFRLPGLDADLWFVALTDPEVNARDWPTVTIVVTATDGTITKWNLLGEEVDEVVRYRVSSR